jgi:hypothetical protein
VVEGRTREHRRCQRGGAIGCRIGHEMLTG